MSDDHAHSILGYPTISKNSTFDISREAGHLGVGIQSELGSILRSFANVQGVRYVENMGSRGVFLAIFLRMVTETL